MRPVEIPSEVLETIETHARSTYPEECCGFLVTEPDPSDGATARRILRAVPAANDFEGERRRRFLLRPEELRAAERALDGTGHIISGFYHSHPEHPARPSQFDQDHAWPWYSYLVVAVTAKQVGDTRAFELDPDSSEFREVPLRVVNARERRPKVVMR